MTPYGVYRSPPARIFEGTDEVDVSKKEERPAGSSEDNTYFWKMTQDKRFIEAWYASCGSVGTATQHVGMARCASCIKSACPSVQVFALAPQAQGAIGSA